MDEFSLIKYFFDDEQLRPPKDSGAFGIGDDCCLIPVSEDYFLAQSIDTIVEGVHFHAHCSPYYIGYRAAAVALSDLAAMGAKPHSVSLSLTLKSADTVWLNAFSLGFKRLLKELGVYLLGGDTTKGSINVVTVHVQGYVSKNKILQRNKAVVGDLIYVSGTLGDAAGALSYLDSRNCKIDNKNYIAINQLLTQYYQPQPRLQLGQWLCTKGVCCAIDISDGFLADLSHILTASDVSAQININKIPLSDSLIHCVGQDQAIQLALAGGDDYEICFTAPASICLKKPAFLPIMTCVGKIIEQEKYMVYDNNNIPISTKGYTHF